MLKQLLMAILASIVVPRKSSTNLKQKHHHNYGDVSSLYLFIFDKVSLLYKSWCYYKITFVYTKVK